MSETAFPINDLLRRRLQTILVTVSLTSCVASTLFLLLFSEKIGFGIAMLTGGRLTAGFSTVFAQFVIFISLLVFIAGTVIVSFLVFAMMIQRIRDIGLMKAAGCPNETIFGYFLTELLVIALISCFLGVIAGILADFASTSLLSSFGFQVGQGPVNFWLVLLVFGMFFALTLIFGAKPILDTTKVEPAKALSPSYSFGLSKEGGFGVSSKSGLTMRIALRSLARHKSATFRIILCLTTVFLLATVGIAGGIIADQTTKSWIEKPIGRDVIMIGHREMCSQYKLLLSRFHEANPNPEFDYSNVSYLVHEEILNRTDSITGISKVDPRLILEIDVQELPGYILGQQTSDITEVGNHHKGKSLIVGINPGNVVVDWFLDGEFLESDSRGESVIGNTLAQAMFTEPLIQRLKLLDREFNITGVCIDPINNGNVTYVLLQDLQNITGVFSPNILLAKAEASANRTQVIENLRTEIQSVNPEFEVFDLNEILNKNLGFMSYIWSAIMFLPLFSLFPACLCLIAYVVLAIDEQRQELGVLRALGARPVTIVKIVAGQSLVVLLSSYAIGIAFGIIVTLLILIPDPIITVQTILQIAAWLLTALTATFAVSLYPAVKFSKKRIAELVAQT